MNEITIINESNYKCTNWSGGTTTELVIFPKNASFSDRKFDLRLSIATVEVETSTFTPLPQIKRTLLVLEGDLVLNHLNHYSKSLSPLEQDSFNGGWTTQSSGKVKDFNLMTSENFESELIVHQLENDESIEIKTFKEINLIYIIEGAINIDNLQANKHQTINFKRFDKLKSVGKSTIVLISANKIKD